MRVRCWILWVVLVLPFFGVPGAGIAQVDEAPSLAGVIDIHAHAAPETAMMNFKRAFDAIEAAQIARIYGSGPLDGSLRDGTPIAPPPRPRRPPTQQP